MESYLERGHWDKLEADYFQVCKSLAGEKDALKINKINLKEYEYLLKQSFAEVLQHAQSVKAKAILSTTMNITIGQVIFLCTKYTLREQIIQNQPVMIGLAITNII